MRISQKGITFAAENPDNHCRGVTVWKDLGCLQPR